jgi:hypothetical protein
MTSKIVHNISGHHLTKASSACITIGHQKIRPGKHAFVPTESLTGKVMDLHGTAIWVGDLPKKLVEEARPPEKKSLYMDREQTVSYLKTLSLEELSELNSSLSAPFIFLATTTKRFLVYKIASACFSQDMLDPGLFFWLGRWKKLSNGDYQEL